MKKIFKGGIPPCQLEFFFSTRGGQGGDRQILPKKRAKIKKNIKFLRKLTKIFSLAPLAGKIWRLSSKNRCPPLSELVPPTVPLLLGLSPPWVSPLTRGGRSPKNPPCRRDPVENPDTHSHTHTISKIAPICTSAFLIFNHKQQIHRRSAEVSTCLLL